MSTENNTEKNVNNTGKKKIYQILAVVFLFGFFICMGIVLRDFVVERKAENQYEQLANNVITTDPSEDVTEEVVVETETEEEAKDLIAERGIEIPKLELDWTALADTNEHIYSWIYIPDTKVNYPVVQHPEEMDYYLDHNLDHSTGLPGCIYTQNINATDYSDNNTVIYGHNMKNGTMFKGLHQYTDRAFFKEHPYIYVYTPEKVLVYEVYGACEVSDTHLLFKYDFWSGEGLSIFLEDIEASRSMSNQVAEDFEMPDETKLITLSTCIANKPNNRWIVVGVLLGEQAVE